MPLQDTFRDIKASLEASHITLPSANDFEVARRQVQERSPQNFYGYLFEEAKPFPRPTPVLVDLLRAIALHIRKEFNDTSFSETFLTPGMLSSFYKAAGYDLDSLFMEMPHQAISFIYQVQSCQHALISDNDSALPTIPALTANGFVRWQAIQILLDPQNQVPVMQYAVENWNLKHPDDETLFPTHLASSAFPAETDPDTDFWHQRCANTLREQARDQRPAGDIDTAGDIATPRRDTDRLPNRSQESLRGTAQRDRRRRGREEGLEYDSEFETRGVRGRVYPEAAVSPPYEAVWRPTKQTDDTVDTLVDSSDEPQEVKSKGKEDRVGRKKRSLST
ncbi:hypothetical protein B0T14DRAFT_87431 [Immersiella caudata]|uniref:DUF7514 domain-containing protein n=1 Tax=Immersiella caudata TaxID=314043 RepID=A0AA39XHR5_9PEZI|nr:hypothetical protein B0T14DRAFT_87431 [Immersiella caudata]